MIPRLGDGNLPVNSFPDLLWESSLENDSPFRGRKQLDVDIDVSDDTYLV